MKVSLNNILSSGSVWWSSICLLRWVMSFKETSKIQDQLFKNSWNTHQVRLNTSLTGAYWKVHAKNLKSTLCAEFLVVNQVPDATRGPGAAGENLFRLFPLCTKRWGGIAQHCSEYLFLLIFIESLISRCCMEIQSWQLWRHWSRSNHPKFHHRIT